MDCIIIRPLLPEDGALLKDFLYEAIYVPEGAEPPPREVLELPELKLYYEDFGKKRADYCLVAEDRCLVAKNRARVVGAVWTRIMCDYGHVDDDTPSLAISLYPAYRRRGIGRRLMQAMSDVLKQNGYSRVSLSVQKENYAVKLYRELGFKTVKETEEEYVMVRNFVAGH